MRELPVKHVFRWRAGLPGSERRSSRAWRSRPTRPRPASPRGRGAIIVDLFERRPRDMLSAGTRCTKRTSGTVWEIDRIEERPMYALGLADIALWDLTAKIAGCRCTKSSAATATGFRLRLHRHLRDDRGVPGLADQCLAYGFRAIKLHAWGDTARTRSSARTCATRRDEIELMYDGSADSTRRSPLRRRAWRRPATSGTRSRCGSSTSTRTAA